MLREYLRLRTFVRIPWCQFAAGLLCTVLSSAANGASLSVMVPFMDRIFAQKEIILPRNLPASVADVLAPLVATLNAMAPETALRFVLGFIVLSIFVKSVFMYCQNTLLRFFGIRILTDLKNRIYAKIMGLSLDFFAAGRSGEITTRIIYDVDLLNYAFSEAISSFLLKSVELAVFLLLIFLVDWKLSIVALLVFPVIFVPVFRVSAKLRKLGGAIQEEYAKASNIIQESVYAQPVIKAFNQEESLIRKFVVQNENIFRTAMAIIRRVTAISPVTEIMATVATSGIIYYGARKVIDGEMSSGFFFLFLTSLFSLISPIKAIGTSYGYVKQASSVLPRVYSILTRERKVLDVGARTMAGLRGDIEFRKVSFSFGDQAILREVTFTVRRGEKIGIVGPTGAGKSTLIGLLLRFYDPQEGAILMDGTDIREFTLRSLRESIGIVTQEPLLFYDTIGNNINLGAAAGPADVERAARDASIADFIESLPEKYDTIVGERGITLSGGQRQLVTIARAILKNPPILVLDEATASLDAASEKELQRTLARVMEGRTVFIVAHRLSTLRAVDRILVLNEARIVEEGSHRELYEKNGLYRRLWEIQFAD